MIAGSGGGIAFVRTQDLSAGAVRSFCGLASPPFQKREHTWFLLIALARRALKQESVNRQPADSMAPHRQAFQKRPRRLRFRLNRIETKFLPHSFHRPAEAAISS